MSGESVCAQGWHLEHLLLAIGANTIFNGLNVIIEEWLTNHYRVTGKLVKLKFTLFCFPARAETQVRWDGKYKYIMHISTKNYFKNRTIFDYSISWWQRRLFFNSSEKRKRKDHTNYGKLTNYSNGLTRSRWWLSAGMCVAQQNGQLVLWIWHMHNMPVPQIPALCQLWPYTTVNSKPMQLIFHNFTSYIHRDQITDPTQNQPTLFILSLAAVTVNQQTHRLQVHNSALKLSF